MQTVDILLRPVISEKSASLSRLNQYMFVVHSDATKHEIKKAIESYYDVTVISVTTSQFREAPRRQSRKRIENAGSLKKKAYIQLKAGQVINTEVGEA
jgi:large subunit ribosomal protein L23